MSWNRRKFVGLLAISVLLPGCMAARERRQARREDRRERRVERREDRRECRNENIVGGERRECRQERNSEE